MRNSKIIFIERKFPSANMVLIKEQFPILIDTGFGRDGGYGCQSINYVK